MTAANPPPPLLGLAEMQATHARLSAHVLRTPVVALHGRLVEAALGGLGAMHLKLELLQRTGTFKARGALHGVMALDAAQRVRGVTAVSAGNHAIAVAFAAQRLGVSAKLVVMASANPARLAAAQACGVEIVIEPDGPSAFARAERIVREEGRHMIHPFDGPSVALATAGVGLELVQDLPELDAVVVAVGGGGLAGGVASAVRALRAQCRVYGVEPSGANAMQRSLAAGAPQRLAQVQTIADSLAPPMTLDYPFALCRQHLQSVVSVSDDEICRAMAYLFHDAKLAVEPAGAAALAGALGPLRAELQGQRVAFIVCGANIDVEGYAACLRRGQALLP